MLNLFFSADGRINSAEFRKGAIILLAFNFFTWPTGYFVGFIYYLAIMAVLVSIYCWGCLFAKRFHDANKTGWFFLPLLVLFVVLAFFLQGYLFVILGDPEIVKASLDQSDLMYEAMQEGNWQMMMQLAEADPELQVQIQRAQLIPGAIAYFLTGAAIAFGVNKLLKTDPNPNRWG